MLDYSISLFAALEEDGDSTTESATMTEDMLSRFSGNNLLKSDALKRFWLVL